MQKFFFIVFFFGLTIGQLHAQKFVFPNQLDSLGSVIKQTLYQQRNEISRHLGDQVKNMWYDGTIAQDEQKKIHTHLEKMLAKGIKPGSIFSPYFSSIVHAKTTERLDTQKFGQYLNVFENVIDTDDPLLIHHFLKTSSLFFEHRAIYYAKSNKVFISEDSYQFEFVEADIVDQALPEIIEEPVEEDEEEDWEEEDWEEEDWEEEDWEEEDWEEEEDTDNNWKEKDAGDERDLVNTVISDEVVPVVEGPVIRFDKVKLNIVTGYDSVFVQNTKGVLVIKEGLFIGKGGRFDWPIQVKDSVESSEIYAELYDYSFEVKNPFLSSSKVLLTHNEYLNEAIEGTFEFRSVKHDHGYFPHFTSHSSNIDIKNLGSSDIRYQGGFSLKGHKMYSSSLLNDLAQIDYLDDSGQRFKTISSVFEFGDSVIVARKSAITIYNGYDSLYHPSVKFTFDAPNKKVVIQKNKGSHHKTSFYDSFFNMNIEADLIKWNLNSSRLDISLLGARKELSVYFESVDHFDSLDFKYVSGIYPFNPLNILVSYNRQVGDQFYVSDLAEKYKINQNILKGAMQYMEETGFVQYDTKTGEINLKPKLFHYVNAYWGKKDYDDIIINSRVDTVSNAVYDLREKKMLVRGVKELYLSDPLNVKIVPDTSRIVMTGNRNFIFDGRITAGNLEYIGRNYSFEYDSFLVRLKHVDSMKLYVKKKTKSGRFSKSAIDNTLSLGEKDSVAVGGVSSTLYINRPDNKSGKLDLPNYPKFDAAIGAVVAFSQENILDGVYGKGVYFRAPPFAIDSLNNSDPTSIKFDGTFVSDRIFPDFEVKLHTMDDYSLGFDYKIPEDGYQLFEGEAKFYGDIKLNKKGIRGRGRIDYLAATLHSEDFIYYPDSVFANGFSMEIREEEHNGVIFPQMTLNNFDLHWLPKKDSMYIYNLEEPFQLYDQFASFDGMTIMTAKGVYGKGSLTTRDLEITSEDYSFLHDQFSSRRTQLQIKSDDPKKPVLYGENVLFNFILEENYADITAEVEGDVTLRFPYIQMNTSMTNARWDLNKQKIFMHKPKNVSLENSYFYTINEALDSLNFHATSAEYDINSLEMKVSGIPYIIVADAKVTPENGQIFIRENSYIEELTNTIIVLDTLNEYHRLYDGVIDIKSRNEFSGHATYEYINVLRDTFAIQMKNFHLKQSIDTTRSRSTSSNKKRTQVYVQHTVANGSVIEEDRILVSPGFFFKGDMILSAEKPSLKLDGYVRMDLKQQNANSWIRYTSEGNQKEVVIPYNDAITEGGRKMEIGLYFSAFDNNLFNNFLEDNKSIGDGTFFTAGGDLFFNSNTNEFVVENAAKAAGESFSGKVFAYNQETNDIKFEGPLTFFPPEKGVSILASGSGTGNTKMNQYSINSLLSINFKIPQQVYQQMATDIVQIVESEEILDGLGDPIALLYKLGDIVGDPVTKTYEEASKREYTFVGGIAKEVARSLVFADVNLKWSNTYHAFYSEGKLGMSNILFTDINGALGGFMEIKKDEGGGPVIYLFLKASAESWYFFGYEADRLMLFSSNEQFNSKISSKSNASKAKAGELGFYSGSEAEVLDFIHRFRRDYYGIEDFYDLTSPVGDQAEKGTEDGFGGVANDLTKKTPTEEEEEDDGF